MTTYEKIIKEFDKKYPNVERWKYEDYCKTFADILDETHKKVDQCFCQSYVDDNGELQDCTCGKCA